MAAGFAFALPDPEATADISSEEEEKERRDGDSALPSCSSCSAPHLAMLHSSWLLPLLYTISCLVLGVALFVLRALFVIRRTHSSSRPRRQRSKDDTASLAIFLGSGACKNSEQESWLTPADSQEAIRQR